MEQISNELMVVPHVQANELQSSPKAFIEANTVECTLGEIQNDHIIPVFIKDNEPLISHADFVETTMLIVDELYSGEVILQPNIRVSHPIKGRVPEAKNKPAIELLDGEKTLYYERMAFVIEKPSVFDDVEESTLTLTVGGVKSFSLDNLYNKKGSDEHFKIFIGFKNSVCTNLCVWTDGFKSDAKVTSIGELHALITHLIKQYNKEFHMRNLKGLLEHTLSEHQFAQLIGRLRMYQHLPRNIQAEIPALYLGDTQINMVVRDYYKDHSFCRGDCGAINLWRLYNLLTGANKSSYIESYLERSVNAFHFTERIKYALMNKTDCWFLN